MCLPANRSCTIFSDPGTFFTGPLAAPQCGHARTRRHRSAARLSAAALGALSAGASAALWVFWEFPLPLIARIALARSSGGSKSREQVLQTHWSACKVALK